MNEITALIDAVERYGFECEAGPLTNCVDWQKLRAAIAALNPWQPIETAPKDGTRILTCVLGSDGRAYDYQINEWNDPRAVADGNGIGSVGWWRSRPSRQPTHWHPLTTPPAQESANG